MTGKDLLRITRAPNLITAMADILAGAIIAANGLPDLGNLVLLCLASCCIYAGGVVQNDIVDVQADERERPLRPIPSGTVSINTAYFLSGSLLCLGSFFAVTVSQASGQLALLLVAAIFIYNYGTKGRKVLGSMSMGLCRAFNLALGLSIATGAFWFYLPLCIFPFIHITGVTLLSSGEVGGLRPSETVLPLALFAFAAGGLLFLTIHISVTAALPVIAFYILALLRGLCPAITQRDADSTQRGVKYGILALPLLNASLVAVFAGWQWSITVAMLIPISLYLARRFYMT